MTKNMKSVEYSLIHHHLSLCYEICVCCCSLPWQGLKAGTKKQKYDKISEKKMFTPIEFLYSVYQFDYIFDWTMLKYPHVGSSSRGRTTTKLPLNPGISAERAERTLVKQEVRDRFSGAVESFTRRNGSSSGLHGDHQPRHRSSENVTPSKDAVSKNKKILTFTFLPIKAMFLHLKNCLTLDNI
uniref:Uncharacterized protein n=1 Tax=Lactuca sativa TaxID=4236 RepID=A0A9R1WWB1_LACSA|nr:hypothetical protein LSAT_V11C800407360 [Lactuca sativa]